MASFCDATFFFFAHYPGICITVAVFLKERNWEMCGMQSLISLLYSSHIEKQIINFKIAHIITTIILCNLLFNLQVYS